MLYQWPPLTPFRRCALRRTIFIWLFSLQFGWEHFVPLQVLGFAVIVSGSSLYNEILRACLPAPPGQERSMGRSSRASRGDEDAAENGSAHGPGDGDVRQPLLGGQPAAGAVCSACSSVRCSAAFCMMRHGRAAALPSWRCCADVQLATPVQFLDIVVKQCCCSHAVAGFLQVPQPSLPARKASQYPAGPHCPVTCSRKQQSL
jgi:hypothetical protein